MTGLTLGLRTWWMGMNKLIETLRVRSIFGGAALSNGAGECLGFGV